MTGHCLFQAVACLVLASLHFSAAGHFWTFAESGTFCFWTKPISNGRTHYIFLHQTRQANKGSLVLYDSIWNKENSLVDCITSNNQVVTKSYISKCWEAGGKSFSETPDERFNTSELVEPAGPCVAMGHLAGLRTSVRRSRDLESVDRKVTPSSAVKLRRSKRAWMIPGTLWCGAGSKAFNFSDLGMFVETDKCCREHDHCKDSIASFGFNYGVFNTNLFTLSHCDCDNKFSRCLHKANESMSDVVGYGYFNVLKMRCFEFSQRMQCAERTWWGMCKFHQLTKYALVKDATYYNSTVPELEEDAQALTSYHAISNGNYTITTDSTMSSTKFAEDTSTDGREWSTVSGQQMIDSPQTETTQSQRTDSPQTERTDSPHKQRTDLPQTQRTDLPQTQRTDSPQTQWTDLPQTQWTDSPQTQRTDSPQTQWTDLPQTQRTDLPQTQRTDSPQTQRTDSPQTQRTDLPQTQRTDSPQTKTTELLQTKITDSPHTPTVPPQTKWRDSPQTQRTNPPQTKTTELLQTQRTDSPHIPTTVSPQTQWTDLPQTKTTELSQTQRTDSPHTATTVSPQTQWTDPPQTQWTDPPQTQRTDPPQTQTRDPPQTQQTDPPQTHWTAPPQTHRTVPPQTQQTDPPQTPAKDSPTSPTTISLQTQTTVPPQTQTRFSPPTSSNLPTTKITDSPQIQTTLLPPAQASVSPKMHIQPDLHIRQKGKLETCESYKDLDSCRHQIPAMQENYGLRNTEFATLYHCDCTARLAKEFTGRDKVDDVHSLLLDFVSQFCFILPLNCTESESCSITSSEAPLIKRWTKDVAGGRPLVSAKRKAKRLYSKRSKRKDSTFRLYKKCLRMHSKLQKPTALKEKLQDHGTAASHRQTLQ